MNMISVVDLTSNEWKALRSLRLKIMLTDPAAYAQTYEDAAGSPEDSWRIMLENNYFVGANIKDELVGMIGTKFETYEGKQHAVLLSVGVNQEFRKMGIATKMMLTLVSKIEARGISRIKLWVSETQKPAIRFYEGFGFEILDRKKDEVKLNGNAYDELIMVR